MKIMLYAQRRGGSRCRWRVRAVVTAFAVTVAGSGLSLAGTVLGTVTPASAGPVPVVAAGGGGSCVLLPDQTVWCWGSNAFGQLGNGGLTGSMVPVEVNGFGPVTDVSAGQAADALDAIHTCAVDGSNRVWCWGSNNYGELGNGTTSQDSKVPVPVQGGLLASQVSAGDQFTCAVTLTHTVECWGQNNYGELGDGTTADSSTPVKVKKLTNVIQVAAGYFHACAVESNGSVWCWGDNDHGDLGVGTTTQTDVPVQLRLVNATSVAAGADDSCAIVNSGDLMCWGDNSQGELGDGDFKDQSLPIQVHASTAGVSFTSGVTQVSIGLNFTCALSAIPSPSVFCWGENGGQLGIGSFDKPAQENIPVPVFGLTGPPPGGPPGGPVQISVGSEHACAVLTSGIVRCWGAGSSGRLGDGDTLSRDIPTPVIGLPGPAGSVSAVAEGVWTGCAVTLSLDARCWGEAVGDGSGLTTIHTSAVPVTSLPAGAVSQVTAAYGGCALVRIGGGLSTDVRCWGDNSWGEIGDGTQTPRTKPALVKNMSGQIQFIASGATHNCAIEHNAGAYCWGQNDDGQLGDGTTNDSAVPVSVKKLPLNLAQIAAADDHTCALLNTGTVDCWGLNSAGQLGNTSTSNSSTPVPVSGLAGVVQIALGDAFSCALTSTGDVQCWGTNHFGELGDGTPGDSPVPVQVSGLTSGVVAIAAGDASACAALLSGPVVCWGDNSTGELGSGSVGGMSITPVTVTNGFTANGSVSLGMGTSACALNTSQQAWCWGDNTFGELGDGTSGSASDSGTPVAVTGL